MITMRVLEGAKQKCRDCEQMEAEGNALTCTET